MSRDIHKQLQKLGICRGCGHLKKLGDSSFFKGSRPEFKPGFAAPGPGSPKTHRFWGGPLQLNLNKLSAEVPEDASSLGWGAGGLKDSGCPTKAETNF